MPRATHSQVERRISAERGLLGREGFAGVQDVVAVSRAGFPVADVARGPMAAQRRVVWLADGHEIRGQVPRHHLARVGKDVDGEEAEGVNSWREEDIGVKRYQARATRCVRILLSNLLSFIDLFLYWGREGQDKTRQDMPLVLRISLETSTSAHFLGHGGSDARLRPSTWPFGRRSKCILSSPV